MKFSSLILAAMTLASGVSASAQILTPENKQSDAGLEDLYDKFEKQENKKAETKQVQEKAVEKKQEQAEISKVSELGHLAPFGDIAVIERRFLPKTNRLELAASASAVTNNPFFNDIGVNARIAYYFNEKYGLEGMYQYLSDSNRPVTDGLLKDQIQTTSLVEPTGYYGAMFKWVPVYGKMAWFQQTIVPFDIYFTPGFGMTTTKNGSAPTVTIGAGQLFALSKSYGIRWDFTWNFYSAKVVVNNSGTISSTTKAHDDLFLGIGFSYFIPEATYR